MPTLRLVPGEWGALAGLGPLSPEQIEAKAGELLAQMSLREKVHQMSGDTPLLSGAIEMYRAYNTRPLPAGENLRLGIPGIRFSDGPRGVVMYHSTCFPVSMARGATWDVELEERVGDAIGVEARSQGANFFGGVCINLLRHPAWGRAQETYGEDPFHLGEMGAALVRGVQRHIMACVKHYAANSIENSRHRVDVQMDERTLREVYLPHFRRCIDAGAASVMGAYNKVNGTYCCHHRHLLREVLKEEWGFEGFVISDFLFGVREARAAVQGGLDIEMPFTWRFGRTLRRLVEKGQLAEALVDEAVLRILRQKIRFAQVGEPERYGPQAVVSDAHRALAREVAQASMVLLRNDPVPPGGVPLLPVDRRQVRRMALLGRLAAKPNTGDVGSSQVRPPYVVTPLEGLQAAAGQGMDLVFDDGRRVSRAVAAAQAADLAVVVAGLTRRDEGENALGGRGDRTSLRLSRHDESLILAVAEAQPRTVVVLMGGGPIITEAWRAHVPAMLMAWYPGMEGGHALADLLFGEVNPSGRLPCVFPRSGDQLPFFDANASAIVCDRYHGYRLMDRDGHAPAFAFGFGLSYTRFGYSNLRLSADEIAADGGLTVYVDVANLGERAGAEVVQLYVGAEGSAVDRPPKELKAFARVHLAPGETRTVELVLPAQRLAYYDDEGATAWAVEPVRYHAYVGSSSRPEDLLHASFCIRG